jgi:hypothetical protein
MPTFLATASILPLAASTPANDKMWITSSNKFIQPHPQEGVETVQIIGRPAYGTSMGSNSQTQRLVVEVQGEWNTPIFCSDNQLQAL